MKQIKIILVAFLLSSCIGFGAQTKIVPPINEVSYVSKLSDEPVLVQTIQVADKAKDEVADVIAQSAERRGWEVTRLENGNIQTDLIHRSHESTLTFKVRDGAVDVYSLSYKINKKTQERKKREEPEGWIRNLHKDILVNLGLIER